MVVKVSAKSASRMCISRNMLEVQLSGDADNDDDDDDDDDDEYNGITWGSGNMLPDL